ncbi:MAG: TldD/PmbA family protein, partial [Chloroflexota bacterium]
MNPEAVLAQALKQAEAAEVYCLRQEETSVAFEANRLKHSSTRYVEKLALRVIREGRMGAATTDGDGGVVEQAVEASRVGNQVHFQFPPQSPPSPVEVYDPTITGISPQDMVASGHALIQQALEHTPELHCEARVIKGISEVTLLNSAGSQIHYQRSFFWIDLEVALIQGDDMLFVGDDQMSARPIKDVEPIGREVISQLERAKRQAKIATRTLPVILTPHGVRNALISPLSMAFNGRMVVQGASPLSRRLGEKVFHPQFNLRDDATIPYRPSSRPWDDEGIPGQSTPLIDQGVVANFFYDLDSAVKAGSKSTGNAIRLPEGTINPQASSLIITEGKLGLEAMIRDIKEGLLIDNLMGADQGNILGGEFSGNVLLGYKIENGEVVGRVKNTMVSGNIFNVLREIEAIGGGGRWVGNLYS